MGGDDERDEKERAWQDHVRIKGALLGYLAGRSATRRSNHIGL